MDLLRDIEASMLANMVRSPILIERLTMDDSAHCGRWRGSARRGLGAGCAGL